MNPFLSQFRQIEQEYGVPQGFLGGTFGIESNFGRAKDRPGSQFQGPFQLGGPVRMKYGVSNPADVLASARAAAAYGRDNMKYLQSKGLPVDASTLYLAHQQGAGGASKLLSNPNTPAGMLTNPEFIRANGGDPNAPASAFQQRFGDMFGQKASAFAGQEPPVGQGNPANAALAPQQPTITQPTTLMPGNTDNRGSLAKLAGLSQETSDMMGNAGDVMAGVGAGLLAINHPNIASQMMAQRNSSQDEGNKYLGLGKDNKFVMVRGQDGSIQALPTPKELWSDSSSDNLPAGYRDYQLAKSNPDYQAYKEAEFKRMHPEDAPADSDTIKTIGDQVLQGNFKAMTRLGEKNRMAAWKYIGDQEQKLGLPAGYIQQMEAEQESRKTAEREYGRIDARRNTAANTFLAGASTLIDLSDQMPRDHFYSVNEILNFGGKQLQDPKLAALKAGVNTAINEYANAITTSGSGATVSDKEHAREMLSAAMDHEALKGTLRTMVQEVVRSKDMIYQSNMNRRAREKGQEPPFPGIAQGAPEELVKKLEAGPASGGPQKISSPEELSKLAPGTQFIAPDGSLRIKK